MLNDKLKPIGHYRDTLRESCSVAKIARSFGTRMKLRLLYHGHCFDGVASAATFTRFYKDRIHPEADVFYTGLLHRPGNLFDLAMLWVRGRGAQGFEPTEIFVRCAPRVRATE